MTITIITSENRRLYPAIVYSMEDKEQKNPILDIDDIYYLLYKNQNILVISNQFDQYGKELKIFNGELGRADIKSLFVAEDIKQKSELDSVMTLSEAAQKWGLSNGSTIRKAIERGKFKQGEIKQSGDVWIITYSAMERVFGSIKNQENTYVIYDDYESTYITAEYFKYAMKECSKSLYINAISKESEIRYKYVRDVFIKILKALRDNKKIIIKKSMNNQIKQIIGNEEELYAYMDLFCGRKILSPEWNEKLISDLKRV